MSLKYLVERQDDENESAQDPGSDGMETDKGDLNDYLEGALSSDYDSEDDSDSDEAIKMGKHDSSKDGYNSDDSIDVRKANYR